MHKTQPNWFVFSLRDHRVRVRVIAAQPSLLKAETFPHEPALSIVTLQPQDISEPATILLSPVKHSFPNPRVYLFTLERNPNAEQYCNFTDIADIETTPR